MHSNELPRQGALVQNHLVDSCRQGDKVAVSRTHNDAGVVGVFVMKSYEMSPIQRHQRTALLGGKPQNIAISN
jgi:hypothetical protein